jgi:hypothetical protein
MELWELLVPHLHLIDLSLQVAAVAVVLIRTITQIGNQVVAVVRVAQIMQRVRPLQAI